MPDDEFLRSLAQPTSFVRRLEEDDKNAGANDLRRSQVVVVFHIEVVDQLGFRQATSGGTFQLKVELEARISAFVSSGGVMARRAMSIP